MKFKKLSIIIRFQLIGDYDSGKHGLLYYLKNGQHWGDYLPMVIDDKIPAEYDFYGEKIILYMDDSYGNEDIKLRKDNYGNINIFMMVFSMINKASLEHLVLFWNNDIEGYKKNTTIVLVGMDADIWSKNKDNQNYVSESDIQEAKDIIKCSMVIKWSTPSREKINDLKMKIIDCYLKEYYNNIYPIGSPKKSKKVKDLKVVLVGNSDGGQYQLLDYISKGFYDQNLHINMLSNLDRSVYYHKGKEGILHFYTTSGNDAYFQTRQFAYTNANIILLVFSLIKKYTFNSLKATYINEVKQNANNAAIILVCVDYDKWTNDESNLKIIHESDIDSFVSSFSIDEVIFCSYIDGQNMNASCNTIVSTYKDFKKKMKKGFF